MPDIETTAILRLDELEAQVRKLRADRDAVFFELEELKANIGWRL